MNKKVLTLSQERKRQLDEGFLHSFGITPNRYFSAPGRTEIGGNHTDHQRGHVLAGAVNLDTTAAVLANDSRYIRVCSQGYPMCSISIDELDIRAAEKNTTAALIRGIAARFSQLGCTLGGFDAYCMSTVLPGSGLSSSAAFEVLIATIVNHLYFDKKLSPAQIAQVGQYAENVYFGKPSGLMDQTASAVGGLVAIDFGDQDKPDIRPVDFDFSSCGHALCIVDSRASHADLTDEYAAITDELGKLCAFFGKEVTTQLDQEEFFAALPRLRAQCGDRAVLRAIHEFQEDARAVLQVEALESGDFDHFLQLVGESGHSSWVYLQNVVATGSTVHQEVAVALALCEKYLQGRGAFRVHGGGFAGTVQAFVPLELLESFRTGIDAALGEGACHILSIRPQGGVEMRCEACVS